MLIITFYINLFKIFISIKIFQLKCLIFLIVIKTFFVFVNKSLLKTRERGILGHYAEKNVVYLK